MVSILCEEGFVSKSGSFGIDLDRRTKASLGCDICVPRVWMERMYISRV